MPRAAYYVLIVCGVLAPPLSRASGGADALVVGGLHLSRCAAAYCGTLHRPLDPADPTGRKIPIHFEFYPHSAPGPAAGTLVATEGGPGFAATASREDYLALFRPLLDHRDLLIMDNRGTGASGAVNCPELQRAPVLTTALIGACGRSLGSAAALYSTAFAADDLAGVLDALRIARIDLYGDSYGTYFEQVFAVRHPKRLRSIVLDGAYPLEGPDYAWYPTYAPAMREKFNVACARSAHCARIPGDSMQHIMPALQRLRARPFAASAADANGVVLHFSADAARLATVMFSAAPAYSSLRETDAAARSFSVGDTAPLLRLMAEALSSVDSRDASEDPSQWSSGLAVAVMCQDTPQIMDMRLPPAARSIDFDRRLRERARTHPNTYAPFTLDEYRGLPLDYAFIEQCLQWPTSDRRHPAARVVAPHAPYPDVPALVISGEFDNMTTVADGAAVAGAFAHGRQIVIANSFHVNALPRARSECAATLVRRFVLTLHSGDTSCATQVPELRLAPDFALSVSMVAPATPRAGNEADAERLRCVSAAVLSAGDVLARLSANSSGLGAGLRGGSFTLQGPPDAARIELQAVRWSADLAVSGDLDWRGTRNAVTGELHWNDATRRICSQAQLQVQWPQQESHAMAAVSGRVDDMAVNAELPAP